MTVEYICHACLLIDTGDLRIVTDPWFGEAAYCGQWHLFPKPVRTDQLTSADVVLLSHGHEDHTHEPSLRKVNKGAHLFYPYQWYGGIREFGREMGFRSVTEAVTSKTYQLNPDTSVTYMARNLDSIIVVEHKDTVLVNVNDALHSSPQGITDVFLQAIKRRWPRIDTLFCGFGGASYFPNTVHCPGKDDGEIGRAREQLFVHNLCRIIEGLRPTVAVPFAADFVLLDPKQRWINEVRFPRSRIPEYYRQCFPQAGAAVTIHDMYPGDFLVENSLEARSPYRAALRDGNLSHLIDQQYEQEIKDSQESFALSEADADLLAEEIRANVQDRSSLYGVATLRSIRFCIKASDVQARPFYNVSFDRHRVVVRRADCPAADCLLSMDTTSRILRYSFASDWGGDAITIGYGCDIQVFDRQTVESRLDTVCVQLLTRHPRMSRHVLRHPGRAGRYFVTNPVMRSFAMLQLVAGRDEDLSTTKSEAWLTRSRCEVCQVCDLPMLDEGLARSFNGRNAGCEGG